jgi:glutaredoxin-related protein
MEMTKIRVYGKPGCHQCDECKRKLAQMELPFEFIDVTDWDKRIDGWRDRREESVDFLAAYHMYFPMPLPLVRFGNEDYTNYTGAMKRAKQLVQARRQALTPIASTVIESELAVA